MAHVVLMSTFDNQSMSIGCVGKLGGPIWFSPTLARKMKSNNTVTYKSVWSIPGIFVK